jgi:hypothetical protein
VRRVVATAILAVSVVLALASTRPRTGGEPAHHHDVDPISAGLLVLDGAVVLAVVILLIRRPRPR